METKDVIQASLAFLAILIANNTALQGLKTFKFNAKTKQAEYLLAIHKDFFVEERYGGVREILDGDSDADRQQRVRYVKDEPSNFTDFLNFFELVTYMSSTKVLKRKQVEAILGYYLDILSKDKDLREYILKADRSFEHLASFIVRREAKRNRSN